MDKRIIATRVRVESIENIRYILMEVLGTVDRYPKLNISQRICDSRFHDG